MQTSHPKPNTSSNHLFWCFHGEYPLSGVISDQETGDEFWGGLLFQTIRDLGIPLECIHKIESTLSEFVGQTREPIHQGQRASALLIRLYYGKKIIKPGNLAKTTSDPQVKQTKESTRMIQPAVKNCYGGWGFFIIERARGVSTDSAVGSPSSIDIFLYREGG